MYAKVNRNSFRQFMKSRVRYLHVSKRFQYVADPRRPDGPKVLVWEAGLAYRNRAKVRALGAAHR